MSSASINVKSVGSGGSDCGHAQSGPIIKPSLVEALTSAYASLIKRQRTASAAFVRWTAPHKRAHEFAWLEPGKEVLLSSHSDVRIPPSSLIYDSMNKMMATIELNPYERELLYGYPYMIGFVDGKAIRAPVLTIPITIVAEGSTLIVRANEDVVRFNSLPFRSEFDTAAHELALARLIEATPEYPVNPSELHRFCESIQREMNVGKPGRIDGQLEAPPAQPRTPSPLTIVDSAACFVAPKTSYFLVSDLEHIGKSGAASVGESALGWLVGGRSDQKTADVFNDSRKVFFPFASNPSQRRVALLCDDPESRIIVVQGPPGTGKSLTIANVACHLVANGNRVLITSQKDKALDVVDELLRRLDLPQLPMTLLRQDRDSRKELRDRLDSIQKTRAVEETQRLLDGEVLSHRDAVEVASANELALSEAMLWEHLVAKADSELADASGLLRRMSTWLRLKRTARRARRRAPHSTDVLGDTATRNREELLRHAAALLKVAAEHRTGEATKSARNHLREFSKLLARNQTSFKNFSVFDRMKSEPSRCHMLLKILPCWIMTPDDVARLFPCEAGLFDVVIIDEASQCDLPSMTPILYRAKRAVIAGDSKQMQAQRFAFTSNQVAAQAWQEQGLHRFDPDRWLDPAKIDLLQLASIRLDEEAFLDEHFRCLPPIVAFSNKRWYGDRMRIMRDYNDRRFGEHAAPIIQLHHVKDGYVQPGTRENQREAQAVIDRLKSLLCHPAYYSASFGIICLFEEQMRLVSDLAAEQIAEEERISHNVVVVNPDGFQGDERDVILYSLSFDANGMQQPALSARQAERAHIQGMLNVAFTRARDEIHIFHTAPVEKFGMASGQGAIKDWLEHCTAVEKTAPTLQSNEVMRAQSEFEAQVIQALSAHGVKTIAQYPSCGYFIDVVAETEGGRLAIECDGEIWHHDEHGELKLEDVQRQEILERAGWTVIRVPYRGWQADAQGQLHRILSTLAGNPDQDVTAGENGQAGEHLASDQPAGTLRVTLYEEAVIRVVLNGARDKETVLKAARAHLGRARLGAQIRSSLEYAIGTLESKKLLVVEDGELFPSEETRTARIFASGMPGSRSYPRGRRRNSYSSYQRW
jgi:very-short-patch-repair endonuclease